VPFSSLEQLCHSCIQQFGSTVVTARKVITEGYDFAVASGNGQYFSLKFCEEQAFLSSAVSVQ
jgi:hypothetical protein